MRKQKETSDVEITVSGTKGFYYQMEEGKGGVAMDDSIPPISSEKITLKLQDKVSYPFPDIFNDKKIHWSEFKRRDSIRVNSHGSGGWGGVEPAEMFIDLKWKEMGADKRKQQVIKVEYSYGD